MNALEQYRIDVALTPWEARTGPGASRAGGGGSAAISDILSLSHHGLTRPVLPTDNNGTPSETTQQHRNAIGHLKKEFVFRNVAAVSSFLEDHRTVPQGLLEALPDLREHFGRDCVFALEVWIDEQGVRELYVLAIWRGAGPEAVQSTIAFNEAWAGRSYALDARVNVSYELA